MVQVDENTIGIGCKAYIDGYDTSYGYIPSKAAGVIFVTLFSVSLIVHLVQFSWKRIWWCSLFSIGCMVEVLGWAGRLWASQCPYNSDAFMIQIATLIIAPVFFTGAIYVLLGRLIQLYGRETSILSAKQYLWVFCGCDVLSLVVQAVGGGLASSESGSGNSGNAAPGTNTMLTGVVIQLVSITVFVYFAIDFLRRTHRLGYLESIRQGPVKYLLGAMFLSIIVIYIRSIYRVVELSQGWSGYVITHEIYFVILDGIMMVIAVGVFNVFHPGWLLPLQDSFALPKFQSSVEMQDPEGRALTSRTEYTPYSQH